MTDMQDRVDRLDAMIEEGRVLRGQWTDGHERACLLAAISPEAGSASDAIACPAHVMPAWLAHLTTWIDDGTSAEAWPRIIRRYASLARRWGALDDAAWERARVASLVAIVSEARGCCPSSEVCALAAIDGVLEWLRRGAPESERVAVPEVAYSATNGKGGAAAVAAAGAATVAAGMAAAAAAWASAAVMAAAAAAWAAAASEGRETARLDASDRIATAVLDCIEAEIAQFRTGEDLVRSER